MVYIGIGNEMQELLRMQTLSLQTNIGSTWLSIETMRGDINGLIMLSNFVITIHTREDSGNNVKETQN